VRSDASHLPRLKDLDGLDIRFLAPAVGIAFGQHTASRPFGAAVGRDALGPELARRVRGEVDHHAVRVDAAPVAALVHLAGGISGLELEAHDYSVMKAGSADPIRVLPLANLASATKLRRAPGKGFSASLVALPSVHDLLLCAKHLFVGAKVALPGGQ